MALVPPSALRTRCSIVTDHGWPLSMNTCSKIMRLAHQQQKSPSRSRRALTFRRRQRVWEFLLEGDVVIEVVPE